MTRWYVWGLGVIDDLTQATPQQQAFAIPTEPPEIPEDDSADARKKRTEMSFEEWQRKAAEVIAHKEKTGK